MNKNRRKPISEYKSMWLFTMFDLPVVTTEERKRYAHFRKFLIRQGFTMLQFSVYARFCRNEERAKTFRRRIRKEIPPGGSVRVLSVTERQFGKMENYEGKKRIQNEKPPEQLLLF
jgi:CRISPR-associated protein Cas2